MSYLGLFIILFFNHAWSYQSSKTSSDKNIKWNYPIIPIRIDSSLSSAPNSYQIIQESINEWNEASSFKIVPTASANNSIKFSNDFSIYGSAVIGITEINYGTSGIISNASILLNDDDYDFKEIPGMAFGKNVYLKDVVTHELGHLLGLGHSEVLDASMFYANFPGQSDLSDDDIAGVRSKYETSYGKVVGTIKGGNSIGVLGVHVQLISRSSGKIISGISDEHGYFEIGGLSLNDTYYLYTSPLKKTEAIAAYYSNVQSEFCPSHYVGSFFSACGRENDGIPQSVFISPQKSIVDVGIVSINCSLRTQEDYTFEKLQSAFNPLTIFNYSEEARFEKSYVGFFRSDELSVDSFTAEDQLVIDLSGFPSPSGKSIEIKLISQPLGNPIEYEMEVFQNGSAISGSPFRMTTHSPEGTLNLDLFASKNLSTIQNQNIFEVKIKARKLSYIYAYDEAAFAIPDFENFGAKTHYPYLLVTSLKSGMTSLVVSGSTLSDNSSCLDAPFTYAVKKSIDHSAETSSPTETDVAVAAACATLDSDNNQGPGPGGFMMLISMGFLLSLFVMSFAKRAKNFLS